MGLGHYEQKPVGQRLSLIPEDFVDQVKERADLAKIIGRSVALRKSGPGLVGLCPFHKEKSPSFSVSPDKGFYKCFGCGAAGSALTFLMEHDGTPFRDAVIELAHDAGLALPVEMTGSATAEGATPSAPTGPIYTALERASRFFSHVLAHTPEAKDYLKGRGLTADSLKRFVIGMAPEEWRGLKEAFPDYESNQVILDAGLIREKESEGEGGTRKNRYDYFRNRVTFGVRDTRGRIIAFGARVLGAGSSNEPKYLNSPETAVFHKSGALFGLFEARQSIREKGYALAVEGYMDVVMLAQAGVQNAVATMGTSFTRQHAERLLTQADRLVFAFDGDAAGRKAANRALEIVLPLVEDRHDIRFLICPPGKDPDDLAREEGAVAFEKRVDEAASLSAFLISEVSLRHGAGQSATPEVRARFAAEASELAGRIGYRTKLRKLVLAAIEQESQVPGAALTAIRQAERASRVQETLWTRLTDAVRRAPAEAVAQRDVLLELLDLDDAGEAELSRALTEAVVPPADPKGDSDPGELIARDALQAAIDLIADHREAQMRTDLRSQFNRGEISEGEFMRRSLAA